MLTMRVLLVAMDFSDLSPRVLAYANTLAVACQARLVVVHVVHDLAYFVRPYQTDTPMPALQQHLEAEALEQLEALCQSHLAPEVAYETLVCTGRPVNEIQRLVRTHAVDCLILGAHSAEKPEHQLFGSTAERLLQHITCPVFLVPMRQTSEVVTHG